MYRNNRTVIVICRLSNLEGMVTQSIQNSCNSKSK